MQRRPFLRTLGTVLSTTAVSSTAVSGTSVAASSIAVITKPQISCLEEQTPMLRMTLSEDASCVRVRNKSTDTVVAAATEPPIPLPRRTLSGNYTIEALVGRTVVDTTQVAFSNTIGVNGVTPLDLDSSMTKDAMVELVNKGSGLVKTAQMVSLGLPSYRDRDVSIASGHRKLLPPDTPISFRVFADVDQRDILREEEGNIQARVTADTGIRVHPESPVENVLSKQME